MRVFRLREKISIYLVLANVGSKKVFFFSVQRRNCGMSHISLISTDISTKSQKSALLLHFSFFFYMKGGNLDAASKACISNFVDKNV